MNQRRRTIRRSAGRAGFTLIEILVVVAVIGILMALMMAVSKEVITQSNIRATKLRLVTLHDRTEDYKDRFRAYPAGDISSLVTALGQMGDVQALVGKDYFVGGTIVDAWKNPIHYYYAANGGIDGTYNDAFLQNNRSPLFVSSGPNGAFDYTDDIIVPEPK